MNSIYGTAVVNYKENKHMNREYIVVHPHLSSNKAALVFKNNISAIIPIDDNGYQTEIRFVSYVLCVKDSYEDVVKQMFK